MDAAHESATLRAAAGVCVCCFSYLAHMYIQFAEGCKCANRQLTAEKMRRAPDREARFEHGSGSTSLSLMDKTTATKLFEH